MTSFGQFLAEVKVELGKVVWPSYEEWVGSTIVVLLLVLVFGIYLGGLDFIFSQLASFVFQKYGLS